MIGELFNKFMDEVVGDDPATRRVAALPYLFAKHAAYAGATGDTLENIAQPNNQMAPITQQPNAPALRF